MGKEGDSILFVPGGVTVRGKSGIGYLLFTKSFVYGFRPIAQSAYTGGMFLGLLGYFIGSAMDARRAKQSPPAFFKNSEIAELDRKIRDRLLVSQLIGAIPLASGLVVTRDRTAFIFASPTNEYPTIRYGEILHQKKVLAYLDRRGIAVERDNS